MIAVSFLLILIYVDLTPNKKLTVGWVIILLIISSVAKNFAVVIYFGIRLSRSYIKGMFDAENGLINSPSTGDLTDTIESILTEEV
jgi:hypothetical protein